VNHLGGSPPPGQCATCVYAQIVTSSRGSSFVLCKRALTDPAFQKYPRLPVTQCPGYVTKQDATSRASRSPRGPGTRHSQNNTLTSMIMPDEGW
jgi:hypothetical protein